VGAKLKTILAGTKSLQCPTVARWEGDLVGCGSANLTEQDDEGLFDCLDCGLFFTHDAALESSLCCPAKLSNERRICKGTNLLWHEKEQYLECSDCGSQFSKNEATSITQRE
jgi:Zn finger protein HypA/HybF involved in hydrogenase expression